jgi:hypothetical protein
MLFDNGYLCCSYQANRTPEGRFSSGRGAYAKFTLAVAARMPIGPIQVLPQHVGKSRSNWPNFNKHLCKSTFDLILDVKYLYLEEPFAIELTPIDLLSCTVLCWLNEDHT